MVELRTSMYSRFLIWTGVFVGSTIGGIIPLLWGAGMFSGWGIILSAVGGILGIWGAVKLNAYI